VPTGKVGAHFFVAPKNQAVSTYAKTGAIALMIGTIVFLSTLYGVHRFYSPFPWWDEWDGYFGFYMAAANGMNIHAWWYPHMEHRIITSRLLFWLDLRYFHGNHIILFAAQLAMLAGIVALICNAARRTGAGLVWPLGLAAALMFSWVQSEVLKWGFETQVIAAYFFAVWALAEFTRSPSSDARRFVAAFFLAACAEFSMGNGIAAPFTLVIVSALLRRPHKETALALVLALILAATYAIGYVSPPKDAVAILPGSVMLHRLDFFVTFFGNPVAMIGLPTAACRLAGASCVIAGTAMIARPGDLSKDVTPYRALLIGVCLFVAASDIAAAYGRGTAGAGAAIASRYTTGPLLGWLAMLLLAFDMFKGARRVTMTAGVLVVAGLAYGQIHVRDSNDYLYDWKLGMLSTKIGLEHVEYSGQLFPAKPEAVHQRFQQYAAYGAAHRLGVYQRPWLIDAGSVKFDPTKVETGCQGSVDRIVAGHEGLTVSGWSNTAQRRDVLIVLTDAAGNTIGYGITGQRRDDVAKAVSGAPADAGWVGFAKPATGLVSAYAYTGGKFCALGQASIAQN